jgi:hypothetical protein
LAAGALPPPPPVVDFCPAGVFAAAVRPAGALDCGGPEPAAAGVGVEALPAGCAAAGVGAPASAAGVPAGAVGAES